MSPWKKLRKAHEASKKTRQRGDIVANQLATQVYLRGLEEEVERVRLLLIEARLLNNCPVRMDEAQQRIHRVINKQVQNQKRKLLR